MSNKLLIVGILSKSNGKYENGYRKRLAGIAKVCIGLVLFFD